MSCVLGIDIGSTTAKIAVVSATGRTLHTAMQRHAGRPRETAAALIAQARRSHEPSRACAAGSIGTALARELHATPLHEVSAATLAADALHPGWQSMVELGGQDAKLLVRTAGGGVDAQMNDRCAAGTGATLDRIVRRLGIAADELGRAALTGALRVASKCGVFAETDLVNLLQRGATRAEVLSALARALVVQNLSVLARGRALRGPVLLLGGPHAHWPMLAEAWRQALGEATPVVAPADGDLYVALGAARHALANGQASSVARTASAELRDEGPLLRSDDDRDELERLRCEPLGDHLPPGPIDVHIGVDAGSTTVKAVLLDRAGRVLAGTYAPSTGNPLDDARGRLRELTALARRSRSELVVCSLGVTGYGAELLGPLLGADSCAVETLAHAAAARAFDPRAQVVVDVGGTDIKVLRLTRAGVAEFFVSNQCSAGHGAFVAAAAAELGVPVGEIAERALRAARAPRFTVGCAVFMDSDRVAFARDGYGVDELLAGLARTVARNVWEFVVQVPAHTLGARFLLTGGTQRNLACAWAQRAYLREHVPQATVLVHPQPELCGAIGAALLSRASVSQSRAASRFRGLPRISALQLQTHSDESLRCRGCALGCARARLEVRDGAGAPQRSLIGHSCERGAQLASAGLRGKGHAVDLFADEATSLFRWPAPLSGSPSPSPPRRPVIGIPRVMCMYRAAPLLLGYLSAAGLPRENVVWSPVTTAALFQEGARRGANDPCFPAKLVHAHVDWLLSRKSQLGLDALLLPAITHAAVVTEGTADRAACPIVAASGHLALAALRRSPSLLDGVQPLLGELDLSEPARLSGQVRSLLGDLLGLDASTHERAFAHGLAAAQERAQRRRARGARVLEHARRAGRAVAVVLSRPYHADPGVSHGISRELAARGVPVLGISALPLSPPALRDLGAVLPELTNSGCGEKLWAARFALAERNVVTVDLSSFRCGQDASLLAELTALLSRADKPALWLHDLDEDRPAVSLRLRIETFTSAVRQYERRALQPQRLSAAGEVACAET